MELTVCFGEYLEKWLLQGLRNTLHKAARERLGQCSSHKVHPAGWHDCNVIIFTECRPVISSAFV